MDYFPLGYIPSTIVRIFKRYFEIDYSEAEREIATLTKMEIFEILRMINQEDRANRQKFLNG